MHNVPGSRHLLIDALIAIIGLILLITRFRIHSFVAPILASRFPGLISGMLVAKIVQSFQDGFDSSPG
ncbi:GntP family permease [Burkholderia territorii]|uniref:GntP family permease n=1 Tax=Burkholderia territorii TaxID=1503055 RepID=UPI000A44B3B4|nr:GntP family permease [Burkholderia territorii]